MAGRRAAQRTGFRRDLPHSLTQNGGPTTCIGKRVKPRRRLSPSNERQGETKPWRRVHLFAGPRYRPVSSARFSSLWSRRSCLGAWAATSFEAQPRRRLLRPKPQTIHLSSSKPHTAPQPHLRLRSRPATPTDSPFPFSRVQTVAASDQPGGQRGSASDRAVLRGPARSAGAARVPARLRHAARRTSRGGRRAGSVADRLAQGRPSR